MSESVPQPLRVTPVRPLRFFEFAHLPAPLRSVSANVHALAETMVETLPDNAQRALGLQHLLAAKDAFVRAAVPEQ